MPRSFTTKRKRGGHGQFNVPTEAQKAIDAAAYRASEDKRKAENARVAEEEQSKKEKETIKNFLDANEGEIEKIRNNFRKSFKKYKDGSEKLKDLTKEDFEFIGDDDIENYIVSELPSEKSITNASKDDILNEYTESLMKKLEKDVNDMIRERTDVKKVEDGIKIHFSNAISQKIITDDDLQKIFDKETPMYKDENGKWKMNTYKKVYHSYQLEKAVKSKINENEWKIIDKVKNNLEQKHPDIKYYVFSKFYGKYPMAEYIFSFNEENKNQIITEVEKKFNEYLAEEAAASAKAEEAKAEEAKAKEAAKAAEEAAKAEEDAAAAKAKDDKKFSNITDCP